MRAGRISCRLAFRAPSNMSDSSARGIRQIIVVNDKYSMRYRMQTISMSVSRAQTPLKQAYHSRDLKIERLG